MFAETYDPENDADEDEGAAAIFPKSDEQRARLIESVKNILLFRSLDKEQVKFQINLRYLLTRPSMRLPFQTKPSNRVPFRQTIKYT